MYLLFGHDKGNYSILRKKSHLGHSAVEQRNTYARISSFSRILSTLGWEKLAHRRESHQVTQLYKITNNDIDVDATHYLQPKTQRSRRGNTKQFVIPRAWIDKWIDR